MDKLYLDHIAVTANTLKEGVRYIQEKLGVEIPVGGAHPTMGTHNCLMQLGEGIYFEVIAIDPQAPKPNRPRWFGLDDRRVEPPRLETWIVRSDNIDETLAHTMNEVGPAIPMSRGELSWRISVAENGRLACEGCHPIVIEWPGGKSPALNMADLGCELTLLKVKHPRAEEIKASLGDGLSDARVEIEEASQASLEAHIQTPQKGVVIFSS